MSQYKTCTKCSQTQSLNAFGKHSPGKDGLMSQCKVCIAAAKKIYNQANREKLAIVHKVWLQANQDKVRATAKAYRETNSEQVAANRKAWQRANPEYNKAYRQSNLEKVTAVTKVWREANAEKIVAQTKAYSKANPEKCAANKKAWREANPRKIAAYSTAYREANAEKIAANRKAWKTSNPEKLALSDNKRRARKLNNGVFSVTGKELKRLYANPCAYCGAPSKHIDHIIPISRGGTHSIGNLVGACAPCNQSKGVRFITEWKKSQRFNTIKTTNERG